VTFKAQGFKSRGEFIAKRVVAPLMAQVAGEDFEFLWDINKIEEILAPGFNIGGTCSKRCLGPTKLIQKFGYGEYDVQTLRPNLKCPNCHAILDVEKVIHFDTTYQLEFAPLEGGDADYKLSGEQSTNGPANEWFTTVEIDEAIKTKKIHANYKPIEHPPM